MQTIELNQFNTTFQITGKKERREIEIKNIHVPQWPVAGNVLTLLVIDEKEITIHSQPLPRAPQENGAIISINERFVFYDHLSVMVTTGPAASSFQVIVSFV